MHSHEYSAPLSPGARTFPRASGLETSRFRAQSTFRRVRSPHRLRGDCYVASSEVFPRGCHARTRSPSLHSAAPFPRSAVSFWLDTLLVRALASPHPSDVEILPTDVCHPVFLFSLPYCTRAHVARIGSRTRIRSIRGAVRFTPENPLRRDRSLSRRVIRSSIAWRPSPLASPVAIPALVLRPLSRTRAILNRRGHFCEFRRDALPAFVTRDAFRQSRFERLPPCGVGRPCGTPVSNPGGLRGYASSIRPAVSVRLCRLVLAFQRARGVPARLASARVDAVPVRG